MNAMTILRRCRAAKSDISRLQQRIEQWQGGDIVVFEGHIGVVSGHRNYKGVTWVLHNGSPLQLQYEEDILARRDDIIGHYRIS